MMGKSPKVRKLRQIRKVNPITNKPKSLTLIYIGNKSLLRNSSISWNWTGFPVLIIVFPIYEMLVASHIALAWVHIGTPWIRFLKQPLLQAKLLERLLSLRRLAIDQDKACLDTTWRSGWSDRKGIEVTSSSIQKEPQAKAWKKQ